MKTPKITLTTKAKLFVAAGIVVAGTSGVAAFNVMQPATADVMTPTQVTVQEHEVRLDKNEADIADTKERVNEVEQKADNATQEVQVVKERVTVVEKKAESAPVVQQSAPIPTPEPTSMCNSETMVGKYKAVCIPGQEWMICGQHITYPDKPEDYVQIDCKTGEVVGQ